MPPARGGRGAPRRRQHFGFRDRLQVELADAAFERERHLRRGLADAGEDDLLACNPGGAGAAILAAGDDVGAEPLGGQRRQHGGIGVRLHRISDERVVQSGQGRPQLMRAAPHHGAGIDENRRADGARDIGQRHRLAVNDAGTGREMVHRLP
jgi:hypothetical protein